MRTKEEVLTEVLLRNGLYGISDNLKEMFYDAMCTFADGFINENEPDDEINDCNCSPDRYFRQ